MRACRSLGACQSEYPAPALLPRSLISTLPVFLQTHFPGQALLNWSAAAQKANEAQFVSNVWATQPLEQISTNLTAFELQQNASNNGESCRLWLVLGAIMTAGSALSARGGSMASQVQQDSRGAAGPGLHTDPSEGLPSSAAGWPSRACLHTACQCKLISRLGSALCRVQALCCPVGAQWPLSRLARASSYSVTRQQQAPPPS